MPVSGSNRLSPRPLLTTIVANPNPLAYIALGCTGLSFHAHFARWNRRPGMMPLQAATRPSSAKALFYSLEPLQTCMLCLFSVSWFSAQQAFRSRSFVRSRGAPWHSISAWPRLKLSLRCSLGDQKAQASATSSLRLV